MSELPPGWEWTTLGDIGEYVNGRAFKPSEWSTSGRPIIRIQNLTGSGSTYNYFDGDLEDKYIVHPGDFLISWAATLGSFVWDGPEGALNQHIFKVQSYIDPRFHRYLVECLIDELYEQTHGSGMVHVTRGKFSALAVGLPPLAEQRRITRVLEDHLSRIEAGRAILIASIKRINRHRNRFIEAACTGLLAPSTAHSAPLPPYAGVQDGILPPLPNSWKWRRLGEVAEVVGGLTKDAKKQANLELVEVPYLRVANVQRGHLDLRHLATIRAPMDKIKQLRLKEGDVLLNEGGDRDKLGRGWVWEGQIAECIHQNHVFRARIHDFELDPRLLAWHANTFGIGWCDRNGKQSVNLASISLSKIRLLPVPIPPRVDQHALVAFIEDYLIELNHLADSLQRTLRRAGQLRRSLLTEAFAGRLEPQDADDEPASVLLERIRAERAAQPKPKHRRRVTKNVDQGSLL